MKFGSPFLSAALMVAVLNINSATAYADAADDIQYLLSFIDQSECVFIRNGTEYDARDARKHIERKYRHLESRLNSANEFIEHAASKSSFSGKAYKVKCGDLHLTTEQWLLTALKDYRSTDHQ